MLLMFAGPSTVGKDARWLRAAEGLGFSRVVPFTTRARRKNERDGVDYTFVTREAFYQLIREESLLDWDYILGEYYGISINYRSSIVSGANLCMQIRATMGLRVRHTCKESRLVMLMASDPSTLERRLHDRGYGEAEVCDRLRHGMEEMAQAAVCDLVVPDADILSELDALRILQDYFSSR